MDPTGPQFRFEVRYTIEELAEAIKPILGRSRTWLSPRTMRELLLIFFGVVVVLVAWFASRNRGGDIEEWDIDVAILPALLPAIYIFLQIALFGWIAWRKTRPGATDAIINLARRPAGLRVLGMGMGMAMGVFVAQAAIASTGLFDTMHVRLTRSQVILIDYVPWIVNFMLYNVWAWTVRGTAAKQQWAANPGWQRTKTLEFDGTSLRMIDDVSRVELGWAGMAKARETKNLFVLQSENAMRYLVPKRVFRDEEEMTRFRVLLQNNVADCEFLVNPTGFSVLPKPEVMANSPA